MSSSRKLQGRSNAKAAKPVVLSHGVTWMSNKFLLAPTVLRGIDGIKVNFYSNTFLLVLDPKGSESLKPPPPRC